MELPLEVVEWSDGPAAGYAGALFLASGVACRVRRIPSDRAVTPWRASPVAAWLDDGKDVVQCADDAARHAVLSSAAIVIVDHPERVEEVRRHAPDALVGVYESMRLGAPPHDDLGLAAHAGPMNETGLPQRSPLFGVGNRFSYGAGLYLFIGLLTALSSERSERPAVVRVDSESLGLCYADAAVPPLLYSGAAHQRTGGPASVRHPTGFYRCADGYVYIFVNSEAEWARLAGAIGRPELVDDPRLRTEGDRLANRELVDAYLHEWLAEMTRAELRDVAKRCRLTCAPVLDGWESVELLRGAGVHTSWQTRFLPDSLRDRSASPPKITRSAPRPLSSLRVLELAGGWAGPLVGRILAAAGAEVVKIESGAHWDAWRGPEKVTTGFVRYPDGVAPADGRDANALFNNENVGKCSALVDLRTPRGKEIFLALVASSDVVVENLRPGALDDLGLGFDVLREANPEIAMVSIAAAGRNGDLVGWGPTIEAMSGAAHLLGYGDDVPLSSGVAVIDALTGLWATAQLLAALVGGHAPVHIRTSMLESSMAVLPEPFVDERWRGQVGNAVPGYALAGCFPLPGADRWVVLACPSEGDVLELVTALDADVASFDAVDGEARHAAIAARTSALSFADIDAALRGSAVVAVEVRRYSDIVEDRGLARPPLVELDHPVAGPRRYPRLPVDLLPTRGRAPRLGEHNQLVWVEMAGVADGEFAALVEQGVIG